MPNSPASSRAAAVLIWVCLSLVLLFLYAPLVPPAIHSFEGAAPGTTGLFHNYAAIFDDARLMRALRTSLVVGVLVAVIAPLLALLAAEAVRVWRMPRLIIAIMLLPLFVPGVSMGLATGLFFQILGVKPSLLTITAVQVLWALPFAFLIILTVMANFDQCISRPPTCPAPGACAPSSRSSCPRFTRVFWVLRSSR
jgi:spermidine/putrescine transport system permease protein